MERRSRTGCKTCRKRRVKCDQARPICSRCLKGNFICEGYQPPQRVSDTRTPPPCTMRRESTPPEGASFSELSWRHTDWRKDQLPLYHHFVTTTVFRPFRNDHVTFWRDQVAQMSYGMDIVHEALLAIGSMHRASLLMCQKESQAEAARFKVFGLRAYGNTLRLLPKYLLQEDVAGLSAVLVVLMLLAFFECFMENPKASFRHLWAAIQILRKSENQLSNTEASNIVPVYDAMLRLDLLAQKLVPYSASSFCRFSDSAINESPFWNRITPEYCGISQLDRLATESYRLIQLVCAHNKLSRVIWGGWCPISERPSRDELMGFYSEMLLWKANSPATFSDCEDLDNLAASNYAELEALPIPPPPFHVASTEAALTIGMFNGYLGCAVAMISSSDPDPLSRELEAFNLVYQNRCIAADLIEKHDRHTY